MLLLAEVDVDKKPLLLIVGDSRIQYMKTLPNVNKELYETQIAIRKGGQIYDLAAEAIRTVSMIPDNRLVVCYYFGGICNITKKGYTLPGHRDLP